MCCSLEGIQPGMALRDAVNSLAAQLRVLQSGQSPGQDGPPLQGLRLEDEGSVELRMLTPAARTLRLTAHFITPDSYPASPCLLCCDQATENQQEALSQLNERFADKASLEPVVQQVLAVFGLPTAFLKQCSGAVTASSTPAQASRLKVKPTTASAPISGRSRAHAMDLDEEQPQGSADPMEQDEQSVEGGSADDDEDLADSDGDSVPDDEDDEEERHLTIACGKRQGMWERFAARPQAVNDMSAEQAAVMKTQIFDTRQAFLMLSRELLTIIKRQSVEMYVDSVGDDVYQWAVELSSFSPGSGLAIDMADVQRRYGYSSVRLVLTFHHGLHPFYPANVEIIRPHFKHWALGAVMSHPLLQLSNWDPLRPQAEFIDLFSKFLESSARVDIDNPLTDISAYPRSCYRPVERYLAHLEALSGANPLCILDPGLDSPAQELYASRCNTDSRAFFQEAGDKQSVSAGSTDGAGSSKKRGRAAGSEAAGEAMAGGAATKAEDGAPKAGAAAPAVGGLPKPKEATYWARGTGYGHSGNRSAAVWNPAQAEAAQRAQDTQRLRVMMGIAASVAAELGPLPTLMQIYELLKEQHAVAEAERVKLVQGHAASAHTVASAASSSAVAAGTLWTQLMSASRRRTTRSSKIGSEAGGSTSTQAPMDAPAPCSSAAQGPASSTPLPAPTLPPVVDRSVPGLGAEVEGSQGAKLTAEELADIASYPPDPSAAQDALFASCLLPWLVSELRTQSFSDMFTRPAYYRQLLRLVQQLCRPECSALVYRVLPSDVEGGCSLASVVVPLKGRADQFMRVTRAPLGAKAEEETKLAASALANGSASAKALLAACTEALKELRASMRLALLAAEVAELVEMLAPLGGAEAGAPVQESGADTNTDAAAAEAEYQRVMRPLQVGSVEGLAKMAHAYSSEASREGVQPSERITRLGREMAGLSSDLAISGSSTVFVRLDEEKMMMWRALMTGPDDTPYSGGCFIFDLYFPTAYPQVCPLVKLKTTGGGTVRFNPNLYNCGKVCLSLLGTWQGEKGEGWMAGVSTANQVFLSIQSLILVEHPFFNEPGFERRMNTPDGMAESRRYSEVIREGTIRFAMLDLLKHPPQEFVDVITHHFGLQHHKILATVDKWISEAKASNSTAHAASLTKHRADLATCLNKLVVSRTATCA